MAPSRPLSFWSNTRDWFSSNGCGDFDPAYGSVITVIGIEQIQAGGDRGIQGYSTLIVAGVLWVLAVMAIRRFFQVAGTVADSIAADADRSRTKSSDDPPGAGSM